ncbi:MAG TPA: trypsin-like peptidase domain-containing protein [Usitatibacter sp.]|nr:trypsin-like peptidase domain-containing protein [Usitatibacter sp.]
MPDKKSSTLYDVLGVKPDAKATDITRAYKKIVSKLESIDAAPDPRLAARAKVAYETLSDPDKRDEYDRSLRAAAVKRPARRWGAVAAGVVTLIAAAVVASMYATRAKEAEAVAPLTSEQILALGEQVAVPMEEVRISGEVAKTGVAVATGRNEMVTPCHTLAAGAQITVGTGAKATHAEMARADTERDICMLKVKDSNDVVAKLRGSDPAAGEKIYTVVRMGAKPSELREGHVTRAIAGAKGGKAYEIVLPGETPNGSPVLDTRGNVIGIVTSPHDFGPGLTVALAASRISQTVGRERAVEEAAENAVAAQPRTSHGTDGRDEDIPVRSSSSSSPSTPVVEGKPRNLGEAYRKLDQEREKTVEQAVSDQVNGKTK